MVEAIYSREQKLLDTQVFRAQGFRYVPGVCFEGIDGISLAVKAVTYIRFIVSAFRLINLI